MALASTAAFASFDITANTNTLDISSELQDAIYYNLNLLSQLNIQFDNPAMDTTFYWNEEALNSDTVTVSGSVTSAGTSVVLNSGHGARAHIGDLLYDTVSNSTEVMQITAISTDTLTVTRAYNSTAAASIADAATLALVRSEQEMSDISTDKTLNATSRSNYTQIFAGAYDLQISGSQLARKMATTEYADFLERQLQARVTELKIGMSRALLYSEKSASAGSDTVYRTTNGLRAWIRDNSGVTDSASSAANYANLNANNKSVVDKGVFPNTLIIGTDLVGSIAGIDSSNRRLVESDRAVGYAVERVLLNQGNEVDVLIDARVKAGDYFLVDNTRVGMRPLNGRAMFVIAATDFTDGKKRRVLAEWGVEVRNPQAACYARNKS